VTGTILHTEVPVTLQRKIHRMLGGNGTKSSQRTEGLQHSPRLHLGGTCTNDFASVLWTLAVFPGSAFVLLTRDSEAHT